MAKHVDARIVFSLAVLGLSGCPIPDAKKAPVDTTSSSSSNGSSSGGETGGAGGAAGMGGAGGAAGMGGAGAGGMGGTGGAAGMGGSVGDPCAGVMCDVAPDSHCSNSMTLTSYSAPGTCMNGTCMFPSMDTNCLGGCNAGVCNDCATSTDCSMGQWCDNNNCAACATDQHCGSMCTDCTATGQVCKDGSDCVQCVVDAHCAAGQVCKGNICVCGLPVDACANGSQTRRGCDKARVIGRSVAKTTSGFVISDNTCDFNEGDNNNTPSCTPDGGYDHLYRIFLRKNEKITVSMSSSVCAGGNSSKIWKIIQVSTGCNTPGFDSCASSALCTTNNSQAYVAPAEGWYAIAADSQSLGDGVNYTLTVKLDATTCETSGCECQ